MMLQHCLKNVLFLSLTGLALLGCKPEGAPDIDSDYGLFDPDHVVQVSIDMDPGDWEALRNQSRSFITEFGDNCMESPFESPYTYFHASIDIDGESLPDVGIRKKGFIGSQSNEKPGFRINLDEYVEGVELYGTDNWTLNNSVQDPSLIRQCITYDRFRAAGAPAPRCNFARVTVNGTDMGIYVNIEPIKRKFLRAQFGNDDGNLYEGTLSDFHDAWYRTFEPKTDETDTSLSDIVAVKDGLGNESTGALLEKYFDVDALMTHLAMETITGHWDGYSGQNHNNFYIYKDPADDRYAFIPWGADGTLIEPAMEAPPFGQGALAHYILDDDELADQFEDRVLSLLDTVWIEEDVHREIDRMEALLATEIDINEVKGLDQIRDYVDKRRAVLERELPGKPGEIGEISCIEEKGFLEVTFETTWGTVGEGVDLTEEGEVDIEMTWDGWNATFVKSGVGAGFSDEGAPILVMAGLIDPAQGSMILPYIQFDPAVAETGQPMEIGGESAGGAVLYRDNSIGYFVQAGFLSGGDVTFDEFGLQKGDVVSGTLSTTIYAWGER